MYEHEPNHKRQARASPTPTTNPPERRLSEVVPSNFVRNLDAGSKNHCGGNGTQDPVLFQLIIPWAPVSPRNCLRSQTCAKIPGKIKYHLEPLRPDGEELMCNRKSANPKRDGCNASRSRINAFVGVLRRIRICGRAALDPTWEAPRNEYHSIKCTQPRIQHRKTKAKSCSNKNPGGCEPLRAETTELATLQSWAVKVERRQRRLRIDEQHVAKLSNTIPKRRDTMYGNTVKQQRMLKRNVCRRMHVGANFHELTLHPALEAKKFQSEVAMPVRIWRSP
ncbi:hypothetical protein B0H17DRAFT_1134323 [Mycena rosella]|uniref:Uncharacterized protein n=1 Tax=Mycena rosella TaxID=1033263 RepID=A0AAD7DGA1_MYCRO|nr:hypothetical protein B0H17DRAFT_1134323 [Mycena rosella]